MPGYRFYPPADRRQDDIWNYTVEKWSEAQADTYIRGLHEHLQKLADNPVLRRPLPRSLIVPEDLDIEVFFSRYRHHYIFFRVLSNGDLGVMSLLHEAMDLPVRLKADLEELTAVEK